MHKKHIITIAGKPGSGKSTTSKKVASALGYDRFSSGDLFRSIAKERGINLYEGNLIAEQDTSIDEAVDTRLQEIGRTTEKIVVDSRMAWHWMPDSFKVYLDLDLETAATRIIDGMDAERREVEDIPKDPKAYAEQLAKRLESESKRYLTLYNQNPYNPDNYDLVVNTEKNDLPAVVQTILSAYKEWLNDADENEKL